MLPLRACHFRKPVILAMLGGREPIERLAVLPRTLKALHWIDADKEPLKVGVSPALGKTPRKSLHSCVFHWTEIPEGHM